MSFFRETCDYFSHDEKTTVSDIRDSWKKMDKLFILRVNNTRTHMRSSQKRGRFEKALMMRATLFLRTRRENTFHHRRRDISSSITPRADDTRDQQNAPFSPNDERTRTTTKQTQQRALHYKNVLLVLKETALLKYTSLVGAAEMNERYGDSYENVVRWDRLKARHETHEKAVLKGTRLLLFLFSSILTILILITTTLTLTTVQTFLKKWQEESGGKLKYALVKRDSLSEKDLDGVDLVVALGGDGTTLIASHWISSSLSSSLSSSSSSRNDGGNAKSSSLASDRPKLIGINTDPAVLAPCLTFTKKAEDERRSTGWLCAADANDVEDVLKEILFASSEDNNNSSNECSDSNDNDNKESSRNSSGVNSLIKRRPIRANRIRIKVNGKTWKTMPLALNDVLICHNSPAALSRYSVLLEEDDLVNKPPKHSDDDDDKDDEDGNKKKKFEAYYHIRSSGLRLCTALGATAAMKSAGGFAMSRDDARIQFHDREPIYYDHEPKPPGRGRGFYQANKTTKFRWNTRVGKIYVDGAHVCHHIKIGDEIEVESAIGDEVEIYCRNFRNIALT